MTPLEDTRPGTVSRGLTPNHSVQAVSIDRIGNRAINRVCRDDAPGPDTGPRGRSWSFDGDAILLRLMAGANRIALAHHFDPCPAIHARLVDSLQHQISAVCRDMLARQPQRFPLADDPGSGRTAMAGSAKDLAHRQYDTCAGKRHAANESPSARIKAAGAQPHPQLRRIHQLASDEQEGAQPHPQLRSARRTGTEHAARAGERRHGPDRKAPFLQSTIRARPEFRRKASLSTPKRHGAPRERADAPPDESRWRSNAVRQSARPRLKTRGPAGHDPGRLVRSPEESLSPVAVRPGSRPARPGQPGPHDRKDPALGRGKGGDLIRIMRTPPWTTAFPSRHLSLAGSYRIRAPADVAAAAAAGDRLAATIADPAVRAVQREPN